MEIHDSRCKEEAMNQPVTTITKKGQVTIPVGIRRSLGLAPGDKVSFVIEKGEVKVRPVKSALDTSFGAVKPRKKPEGFIELERLADLHTPNAKAEPVVGRWPFLGSDSQEATLGLGCVSRDRKGLLFRPGRPGDDERASCRRGIRYGLGVCAPRAAGGHPAVERRTVIAGMTSSS